MWRSRSGGTRSSRAESRRRSGQAKRRPGISRIFGWPRWVSLRSTQPTSAIMAVEAAAVAMRASGGERRTGSLLSASTLLGPATFVVVLGLLLPILILLRYSFNRFEPRVMMVEAVTLANYAKFFNDPFYTNILLTTLRVAMICTVVCLVVAFPLA